MSEKPVSTVIDSDLCTGCGLCVQVCPSGTISMKSGKAVVTGNSSLNCGHCEAVCPVGAVCVRNLGSKYPHFRSFESNEKWIPYGRFDINRLVGLIRSRRSCRNYLEKEVDRNILEDLVNIGICAPSGTNSQKWTFTILPDRRAVISAGEMIGAFFKKLNRLAEKNYLRKILKLLGKPTLDNYYREYFETVREALDQYESGGKDRLFHGASAVIIVGAEPGASCSAEDALLASQNILLGAHALGLGTCLIGFAVEAMKNDRSIQKALGIPKEESIHAVIALGYPKEHYQRPCKRKRPVIRFFGF